MGAIDQAAKFRDEALSAKIDKLSDQMDQKFELLMIEMKKNRAEFFNTLNMANCVQAIERKTAEPIHTT